MRHLFTLGGLTASTLVGHVAAGLLDKHKHPAMHRGGLSRPRLDDEERKFSIQSTPEDGRVIVDGYFQQLIDHDDPSLGTFTQRYWWNAQFYAGPGSPIILNAPGESNGEGLWPYVTNLTLPGVFGQEVGGAVLYLEHRYWGGSSPFDNLTIENLQYLTLDNSLADLVYFARNVDLPFDPTGSSTPEKAPWVLTGGSYAGALAAWTNGLAPGTFWAYHATSAVVQDISKFWQYWNPIEKVLPANCSTDFKKIITHLDDVFLNGTPEKQQRVKNLFGFGGLEYNDDFAYALASGLFSWQNNQFYFGRFSREPEIYQMCDSIENVWPGSNAELPGEEGVGLCKAIKGFAKWSRERLVPQSCAGYGYWDDHPNTLACWDTHDPKNPYFTDTSVNNTFNRQWQWLLCNEPFQWWQVWTPKSTSGLVSQLVDYNYRRRQCDLYFPEVNGHTYGLNRGRTVDAINAKTGGWSSVDTKRLVWVNGEFDPWRPTTVSAEGRPGGPLDSTEEVPVFVIPGGSHCSDLIMLNSEANEGVREVADAAIKHIVTWVGEFYDSQ